MPESSTITTCPRWCSSGPHAIEADHGDEPMHHGPRFGPHLLANQFRGETCASLDDCSADDMTPANLRQLAADALAAAEWIEAHR